MESSEIARLTAELAAEREVKDALAMLIAKEHKAQRRAGAVAGLRGALDDCESVVYADLVPGVAVGERKLLDRIARIERGEVIL